LAQVLLEVTDGQTTVYLLGLGRLAQVEDGEWEWFLGDALGSVRQVVDGDGVVVLARDYAPFGLVRSASGTGSSGYGFTGEQGAVPGLIYLRARFYDPYLNRFLSPDPIIPDFTQPQSLNKYVYCLNNPINMVDPAGLEGIPLWAQVMVSMGLVEPMAVAADPLKSIADPVRNPRAAANYQAFWGGLDAWGGIGRIYWDTVKYTGAAILGGCWEEAERGSQGLAQQHAVLMESVVRATGLAVWQIGTTPVRIFTADIPELIAAGQERKQGLGREWDIVLTANNLAGDTYALYGMYRTGVKINKWARWRATDSHSMTWNEFRTANKGRGWTIEKFSKEYSRYKVAEGLTSQAVQRSSSARRAFLREFAESGKAPKEQIPWLRRGRVPPGYVVDHRIPLSTGGTDTPSNMRLILESDHLKHHAIYAPWRK